MASCAPRISTRDFKRRSLVLGALDLGLAEGLGLALRHGVRRGGLRAQRHAGDSKDLRDLYLPLQCSSIRKHMHQLKFHNFRAVSRGKSRLLGLKPQAVSTCARACWLESCGGFGQHMVLSFATLSACIYKMRLYMYVCMSVGGYVGMYSGVYVRMYAGMHVGMYGCMYVCVYAPYRLLG